MAACHRAFEKAQDRVVVMLDNLRSEVGEEERIRSELIIRKIADCIAVQMLQDQTHIMRRLCIHDRAPGLDMKTIRAALLEAKRLNMESRQTFALLADLTTFIHVADILRVDGRIERKLSLIELKSGRVNEVLLAALGNYKPDAESVSRIAGDPTIQERYKKQAVRMMKQKIRVHRAERFIVKDEGIDPRLGVPLLLSGPMIYTQPFDEFIAQLCASAAGSGHGAGTVDWCFHIGAGHAATREEATNRAFAALNHAVATAYQKQAEGFADVQGEVLAAVGEDTDDNFTLIDLFANNLHSIATRPFLLWGIGRSHLADLISGNTVLVAVFDLKWFVWLARREGVGVAFASRLESEEMKATFGAINIMTWGHKAITYPYGDAKMYFTSGLFSRIANDLMRPGQLIQEMLLPKPGQVSELESWVRRHSINNPNASRG